MVEVGTAADSPSQAALRLLEMIETEFREGLRAARPVGARGPDADPPSWRRAYLELLKLGLCDLIATTTTSVARTREGLVMSRELVGDRLRLRSAGMDWPLHGLTMVGLRRLDDLQECVESVVREDIPGDLIEAGSWRGGASILMRAALDTLEGPARTVYVADSFEGFPASSSASDGEYDLSSDLAGCHFLAVPLAEVVDTFKRLGVERGVEFVPGFFQDTLPRLVDRSWSLIRLDGDTYESIRVALESLYAGLSVGGYVVVDDYLSLEPCRRAVEDFRTEQGITDPVEEVDWSGVRWRKTASAPAGAHVSRPGAAPADGHRDVRSVTRPPRTRVPAIEEVELGEEMERLRRRLADAEAEIERLKGSPIAGPKAWLRGRRAAGRARS
jgi:O-methyltransferase